MTVKTLIEILKKHDEDLQVDVVMKGEHCEFYSDITKIEKSNGSLEITVEDII